jgi:peptide/nickel transport system substrate-binding protein
MKSSHLIGNAPVGRILLTALAILFTLCVGSAAAAAEPGTVTIIVAGEPVNLDPGNCANKNEGQMLTRNVFEALTERNPSDGSIFPRLAQSWKQIDATTWHFFLRKGVKFHDGADFNADAAVFSIKRLYDKRLDSRNRTQYFADTRIDGKPLDSQTLEIRTGKPEPLLPTLMALLPICSPNTPPDKLTRNPVGTGPYKFVKWDAGTQIVLERFDGYWGKQPPAKKAIYLWRTEPSVRATMVLIGEADLTPDIANQDANRPDMDFSYLNSNSAYLRIGGEWEPPLNDKRVRMAFCYAVDRNAMRGTILSKDVVLATHMIEPGIFGYNPEVKLWPYDPQKAKQLLAEARKDGVPVDKEILLMNRETYPGGEEVMEAVMTMYKAVGLNVKLKMLEKGAMAPYENRPFPKNVGPYIVHKTHDNNKGDAVFTAYFKYHCKGVQSSTCDKEVDDLIEKAQAATGEQRRNLWRAAFKRIHEELIPDVTLFHLVAYARVGKRINFKPSAATMNEIPLEQITFK